MIDFFQNGSQLGITISGISGGLLLFYIIIEICLLIVTGTLLWRKILIGFRVWRNINRVIPSWWKVNKISLITISKKKNNLLDWNYECYVSVSSKCVDGLWTNDFVKTNSWGKIIKSNILDNINSLDIKNEYIIKQYNRDSILEELGINN